MSAKSRFIPIKWQNEWGIRFYLLQTPVSGGYVSGGFEKGNTSAGQGPTSFMKRPGNRSAYVNHSIQGTHNATRGAAAEAALTVSMRAYTASFLSRFWREIGALNNDIAKGIKAYGGVAICGRVYMMDMPNPDTGVTTAYWNDTYIMDGGATLADVFPAAKPAFVGPKGPQIGSSQPQATLSAPKFRPPAPMPERNHQVEGHYLAWAQPASRAHT